MGVTTGKGFVFGAKEGNPGRTDSKYYGVYVTEKSAYNTPVREVEMITIPGRNGALVRDKGRFENIEVTYRCGMYATSQTDFATDISTFRNALMAYSGNIRSQQYYYLYDDYNTDEFRMAIFKGGIEVEAVANGIAGEFDVVFDCKPQRFLKTGDQAYSTTSGTNLKNPTYFESQPEIVFKTTGSGTISWNTSTPGVTETITISGAPSGVNIYIDCELGEMYRYNGNQIVSLNNYVSFGTAIPTLHPGQNVFSISNSITDVSITPRWWRI